MLFSLIPSSLSFSLFHFWTTCSVHCSLVSPCGGGSHLPQICTLNFTFLSDLRWFYDVAVKTDHASSDVFLHHPLIASMHCDVIKWWAIIRSNSIAGVDGLSPRTFDSCSIFDIPKDPWSSLCPRSRFWRLVYFRHYILELDDRWRKMNPYFLSIGRWYVFYIFMQSPSSVLFWFWIR